MDIWNMTGRFCRDKEEIEVIPKKALDARDKRNKLTVFMSSRRLVYNSLPENPETGVGISTLLLTRRLLEFHRAHSLHSSV